jgi:hypothetical protein
VSLSDLVALTLVAYQPTLATHYRRHFPRPAFSAVGSAGSLGAAASVAGSPAGAAAGAAGGASDSAAASADAGGDGLDSERCFHLLGFDVLLDNAGRPHLLEVWRSASLGVGSIACLHPCSSLRLYAIGQLEPLPVHHPRR